MTANDVVEGTPGPFGGTRTVLEGPRHGHPTCNEARPTDAKTGVDGGVRFVARPIPLSRALPRAVDTAGTVLLFLESTALPQTAPADLGTAVVSPPYRDGRTRSFRLRSLLAISPFASSSVFGADRCCSR